MSRLQLITTLSLVVVLSAALDVGSAGAWELHGYRGHGKSVHGQSFLRGNKQFHGTRLFRSSRFSYGRHPFLGKRHIGSVRRPLFVDPRHSGASRLAAGPAPVPAGCSRVSKLGRDDSGASVRIGGTLCVDRFGQSYIVAGSRYIVGP